jgi:hypothetical protein
VANLWRIPVWLEQEVMERDRQCVYCRSPFGGLDGPQRERPGWAHIVNDLDITSRENIALCCISCKIGGVTVATSQVDTRTGTAA